MAAAVVAAALVGVAAGPAAAQAATGRAAAQAANPLGTATATAGEVDLDLKLLGGLLGALHLGGADGLDVPLTGLVLGQASAPTPSGDAANFTNSTLRLRDGLISTLHLSGDSADLIEADAVSGTARVVRDPGAYAQAYATVANLRLFLPLLALPGADASNGFLKIDAVSAQATCVPGQTPTASAKTPATIQLLGRQIPVPAGGDVPLNLGLANVDVRLSPVTTTGATGAAASVQARISVNAVGLAQVSGTVVLASATCTSPALAAAGTGGGTSAPAGSGGTASGSGTGSTPGAPGGTSGPVGGAAPGIVAASTSADGGRPSAGGSDAPSVTALADGVVADAHPAHQAPETPLSDTGVAGSLLPVAGGALAVLIGGAFLVRHERRKRASGMPTATQKFAGPIPLRSHRHRHRKRG